MSLESGRLVAGTVVDELGARAEGGGIPFASAIVTGHHHEHIRSGWGELWSRRKPRVIRPDEGQWRQRFDGGKRLGRRGMLERGRGRDTPLSHRVDRLAVAPIEDVVLTRLAADGSVLHPRSAQRPTDLRGD